jgi:hypothetical protein
LPVPLNERTPDENEAISQTAQAIQTHRREGSQAEERPQGRFKFKLYKNNLLGGQRSRTHGAFARFAASLREAVDQRTTIE